MGAWKHVREIGHPLNLIPKSSIDLEKNLFNQSNQESLFINA